VRKEKNEQNGIDRTEPELLKHPLSRQRFRESTGRPPNLHPRWFDTKTAFGFSLSFTSKEIRRHVKNHMSKTVL